MPSRFLHLYKTTKITHVKIVISKNDTNKKRSSPTNNMVQYCKWCYSYCSHARILFHQNASLHGFTSNMQKKKQKLVKKPQVIKFFPPSISNSYLKTEMLCCSLTRMYHTNTKMLLFHILQSPLSGSLMSNSISPQKIWQLSLLGKNINPYSMHELSFTLCMVQSGLIIS